MVTSGLSLALVPSQLFYRALASVWSKSEEAGWTAIYCRADKIQHPTHQGKTDCSWWMETFPLRGAPTTHLSSYRLSVAWWSLQHFHPKVLFFFWGNAGHARVSPSFPTTWKSKRADAQNSDINELAWILTAPDCSSATELGGSQAHKDLHTCSSGSGLWWWNVSKTTASKILRAKDIGAITTAQALS